MVTFLVQPALEISLITGMVEQGTLVSLRGMPGRRPRGRGLTMAPTSSPRPKRSQPPTLAPPDPRPPPGAALSLQLGPSCLLLGVVLRRRHSRQGSGHPPLCPPLGRGTTH